MKTKLVAIIMLLCICLSGCGYEISETGRTSNISTEDIYVDAETGVMYLWQTGYYKGGLSVMVNADGTPKVYKEDTNTYKNVYNISSEDIYVDAETGVMYLWQTGYYKGGGLSTLF